jgi:hypothetical protein
MVMNPRRRTAAVAAAVAGAVAAVGCASATGQQPASGATGQHSASGAHAVGAEGPRINWDSPLPGGKASSTGTAQADGRLPFSPAVPQFGLRPILVQVTGTAPTGARTVAFVYRFPLGKAFPADGRVVVLEYQDEVTETQLEAVTANPPGPAADFTVIRINGHGALLVHASGIGRVLFILHGVMYDVTGPAVSPREAEHLASEIRPA